MNDIIFRRWLRLLFGGEFSSMDLLVLWDAIFATSPQDFALVNHIFVAMLVLIRIQCKLIKSKEFFSYVKCFFKLFLFSVLKSDNTDCLKHLMRYPHVDVMTVIEYALHMFDPKVKLLFP